MKLNKLLIINKRVLINWCADIPAFNLLSVILPTLINHVQSELCLCTYLCCTPHFTAVTTTS